jgi:regulator of cell morphogenesis and NO signaling
MIPNETASPPKPLADRTLGDIAVALPGATALFRTAKVDYCCGGQATLREAAAAKSLDLDAMLAVLRNLEPTGAPSAVNLDTKSLIDLIVNRYHRVHAEELPELIRLATRVEAVHRDHPAAPAGLADMLKLVYGELTMHMQKEELILFPAMAKGGRANIGHPIAAMMAEHEDHDLHMQEIRRLTGDIRAPDDACTTWRALYVGLAKFADDLVEHIHTENNILFPRFLNREA